MAELPAVIRGLLDPRAYPHQTGAIHLLQTHISYLIFTGPYVYKVKKPVDFGFLDYTSLERRRHFCRREVLLNRRLCPTMYLGVVPIGERGGAYAIGGGGQPVEYAVKMVELPPERMLANLVGSGEATRGDLEGVARHLAAFHVVAPATWRVARHGRPAAIRANALENFAQISQFLGRTISPARHAALAAFATAFLDANEERLRARVRERRIRDGHGDVRCDSICLTEEINIFDCIEFSERLRCADVAAEIAFLAMDLDHRGRADLATAFVRAYLAASGDDGLLELLDFYRCYRACVRGKVESLTAVAPEVPEPQRRQAEGRARAYFDLAEAYTRPGARRGLAITCGLPGSGKSVLAGELAGRLGWAVYASDLARKRLMRVPAGEHRYEAPGQGIYRPEVTRQTYQALLDEAEARVREGVPVLIDASFARRADRAAAAALARRLGVPFRVLHCRADAATIAERLESRVRRGDSPSDARLEIFADLQAAFEEPDEVPPDQLIPIDTAGSIAASVEAAHGAILGSDASSLA